MQEADLGGLLGGEVERGGDELSVAADGDGVAGEGGDGRMIVVGGAGADEALEEAIEREGGDAVLDTAGGVVGKAAGVFGEGAEEMEERAGIGTEEAADATEIQRGAEEHELKAEQGSGKDGDGVGEAWGGAEGSRSDGGGVEVRCLSCHRDGVRMSWVLRARTRRCAPWL